MYKNLTILALALTAGAASAQAPAAGTPIRNQATVTFEYNDGTALQSGTSTSNVVTTTVTAVPSYTITPDTGAAALTNENIPAGSNSSFTYTVTNTGNTPLQITLTAAGTADQAPTGVTITENSGTANDGVVTLAPGASVPVTMTYTIPNNAEGGSRYGQNLVGTAQSDNNGDGTYETAAATDNDNENVTIVYTVSTPVIGSPTTNPGVVFPSDPANPGLTPDPANPGTSTGPGYTDPGTPGQVGGPTYVAPDGSSTKYPVADPETENPDVTSLTGSVTNAGPLDDILTIGPATDPDGSGPATVALINPATGQPFVTGDPVQDANGNPIPNVVAVVNPDNSVSFVNPGPDGVAGTDDDTGIPAGTSPAYQVQITYPDTETMTGPQPP
ncbi:hypothetical protein ACFP81_12380 [Deinococcus lacus]|uniref:DUF11 domain-containing protein n=1 Tax=Deinococcus lacus TaxID=392561 RepID=A0ABW1YHQ5_9DEIO